MAPEPRGRGRKRTCTDSHLHAALDAIHPYGFCQDLVQLTLGELLNGGDDEWEFIEEGCYSLLLETILEKINAPQKKDIYAQCKKGDVDDKEASAVGPSIPTCSYSGSNTVVMQTNLIITEGKYNFPPEESSSPIDSLYAPTAPTAPNVYQSSLPNNLPTPPRGQRRPCYGWISDDDDDDDVVEITPTQFRK
ncbi:protein mono-ADP-ribosyltransferase PARP4-like [Fagus crenata]